MTSIIKTGEKDAALLSGIAKTTFIESHGNCARQEDVDHYVSEKYNEDILKEELSDPGNIYHILYHNNVPAGYSKIIFDMPYAGSPVQKITKMERLYLLKAFHDLRLGLRLLQFNIDLAKEDEQMGTWLYVWKENKRAVDFYLKSGFRITGSHNFKISETHSNPNYQMLLMF